MALPETAKFGKMRVLLGKPGTVVAAVAVTNLSKSNPAVITVGVADIAKFKNGDMIKIAGAVGTGLVNANGYQVVKSVNSPVNTAVLVGVDTSAAAAAQTSGVTALPNQLVYGAPCGLTTKALALTKNLQEINIPDCTNPDAPTWLGRDVQNLSANISGNGVAAAESVSDWNNAAMSTVSVPMRVEIEFTLGWKVFEGLFHVDNLTFNAEQGGRVNLAFNALSDGEIVDGWTGA